jgi:hypothetical protein
MFSRSRNRRHDRWAISSGTIAQLVFDRRYRNVIAVTVAFMVDRMPQIATNLLPQIAKLIFYDLAGLVTIWANLYILC